MNFTLSLFSKKIGKDLIPVMTMRFGQSSMALAAVDTFTPERLMLAKEKTDTPSDRLGLTDGNHVYAELKPQENWINDANTIGFFVMLISAPKPEGGDLGRVLVVQFPFGHILANSGSLSLSHKDLVESLSHPLKDNKLNSKEQNVIQRTSELVESPQFLCN